MKALKARTVETPRFSLTQGWVNIELSRHEEEDLILLLEDEVRNCIKLIK